MIRRLLEIRDFLQKLKDTRYPPGKHMLAFLERGRQIDKWIEEAGDFIKQVSPADVDPAKMEACMSKHKGETGEERKQAIAACLRIASE